MTATLAHGYSSESAPRELSKEYLHDKVSMVFWVKVALALEGLSHCAQTACCLSPQRACSDS